MIKNRLKPHIIFWSLTAFLILSIFLAIALGSVNLNIADIYKILVNKITCSQLFTPTWDKSTENIVWLIRLPRILLALIVGSGLTISGILMQTLTKNVLAEPYILGISAGASTGAVASISFGGVTLFGYGSTTLFAFLGAVFSALLVFVFTGKKSGFSTTKMVLMGVAVAALFNAATNYIIFTSHDTRTAELSLFWMTGSLSGAKWDQVPICFAVLIISIIIICIFAKQFDVLLLGEGTAKTLGVNVKAIKITIITVATLLTGVMVAFSGPIGFLGLIVPHITRSIVKSSCHRKILPISVVLGAIILIWSDVLARTLASPEEIPLGIITAFLGAPFFIVMLKRGGYSFGRKDD